ncbi:hypothetical protein BKA24_001766 [Microbacterium marinum]|uniref:Uncharacterized protein n=1 Tax=Microbacterium marinum TaxID=421115 RepID=A0A7W7FIG6_9MICO|nr:hypothetical protein [Microbacterium marinum]MBB4667057.1 hypothetical protein [Microbacterium marinum]
MFYLPEASLERGQTVYPVAISGETVTVEDSLGREHIVTRGDLRDPQPTEPTACEAGESREHAYEPHRAEVDA